MAKRAQQATSLTREIRRFIANSILFNQRLADKLGINSTDYQVLNLLDLHGGATPGGLARLTGLTTGGVTVVLDRLERAHYLRREKSPEDRRSVLVRVVPSKIRRVTRHYRRIHQWADEVYGAYDENQLAIILDFFLRMNRYEVAGAGLETVKAKRRQS